MSGKRKIWPQKVKGPICRVIDRPVPELLACSLGKGSKKILKSLDIYQALATKESLNSYLNLANLTINKGNLFVCFEVGPSVKFFRSLKIQFLTKKMGVNFFPVFFFLITSLREGVKKKS